MSPVKLVLLDRDGTLIEDVPYNGDPALVRAMPTAYEAVAHLRQQNVSVGVITNQSAIGLGHISFADAAAVHARIEAMFGRMDTWQMCPHTAEDGCLCRKPLGLMVERAADAVGVSIHEVAVIGDIGSDVEAALCVGASAVLVPGEQTLATEVAQAPIVASSLLEAVHVVTSDLSTTVLSVDSVAASPR
jgi:D-glycero-D-manno-heptose 1,7-bisphosphate phosphatase